MHRVYSRRVLSLFLLLAACLLIQSCFPSKKRASETVFKNADKWLPQGIKPGKITLLVQLLDEDVVNQGWQVKLKKWNNEMQKFMSENYPFKYEFVSEDDIVYKRGKYADYEKYPFGLMISKGKLTYQGGAAGSGPNNSNTSQVYDFYFIERAIAKSYPVTKKYSSNPVMTFMPVINTLLENR